VKISRQTKFRIAAFIVALTTFLVSPGLPPGKLFEPAQGLVLAAGKMVTLKFIPIGERPLLVSQFEGGLIKVGGEGQPTYAFSPTVTDREKGTVTIKVFSDDEASILDEVAWGRKEARTLIIEKEGDKYLAAYYNDSGSRFQVEVISVKTDLRSEDRPLTGRNYAGASNKCCLSCGGVRSVVTRSRRPAAAAMTCGGANYSECAYSVSVTVRPPIPSIPLVGAAS